MSGAGTPESEVERPAKITRSTLTEQIANRLRDMIIQHQLIPGERVRERTICDKLNVSRTPLREALHILAAEGLIDLIPNRGATIAAPTGHEIEDMLQVLGVLEGFAGERACTLATAEEIAEIRALQFEMSAAFARRDRLAYFKINQRIHLGIVAAARSETLRTLHNLLNARLYRIRYQSNLQNETWQTATREHEEILAALERRDASSLATLLQKHLKSTWKNISQNRL